MIQRTSASSSYDSVMIFYLTVGALGLLFLVGSILSQFGWLEAAIRAIFGEKSESVLASLYGLTIVFTFAFGFYLFVGWIPAIWIAFKYRKMWPIWGPSLFFLFVEALLIATLETNWAMESTYEWLIGIILGLYFLATLLTGIHMLSRRRAPNDSSDLLVG